MIEKGLIQETKQLLNRGVSPDSAGFSGVGYRELVSYLKGEISLEDASALIRKNNRRLIRHQYNWFKLNDKRIEWLDIEEENCKARAFELVQHFLEKAGHEIH